MCTHCRCIINGLFFFIMSWVLNGSALTIFYLSPLCHGYTLVMSWQLSICLHYDIRTYWGVLTIVYLSPSCHGYSFWMSCQSSICLHYVMCTHCGCLDNCLIVSIMSCVLIAGVLTIVYLSPSCHGYSFWMSCQSSICLNYVIVTHLDCLHNCRFVCIM